LLVQGLLVGIVTGFIIEAFLRRIVTRDIFLKKIITIIGKGKPFQFSNLFKASVLKNSLWMLRSNKQEISVIAD